MKKISLEHLINALNQQLASCFTNPDTRNQQIWWIISAITGRTKTNLLLNRTLFITQKEQQIFDEWINKLCKQHIPLQYILGTVPFLDLELLVKPPILIPRPETEEWVARLIDQLKTLPPLPLAIADVGTGSGCIALALAKALPYAFVTAIDINPQALELAQRNAKHNAITNIEFIESDLFDVCNKTFDIIVSNPPYITETEYQQLEPSVVKWEDPRALVAEDNGLAIIKNLLAQAPTHLRTHKSLIGADIPNILIEIGYKQAHNVVELMHNTGLCAIKIVKDLFGNDRCVQGTLDDVVSTPYQAGTDYHSNTE